MLRVTCAVIRNEDNEVLVVQRGEATDHPFKWEFPGGKVSPDESEEECVIREVDEELSIDIVICSRLPDVEYDYGYKQIILIPFVCDTLDELPILSEHLSYKWLHESELLTADFSEADVFVAQSYLQGLKREPEKKKQQLAPSVQAKISDAELQALVNNMMSMQEAEWVAASAIEDPAIFLKLLEYSYSHDKKLAFRASWTLSKVCDKFPGLIEPHLSDIINTLSRIESESTLRSFLRILSQTEMEKTDTRLHGKLADFCFNMMKSGDSAVAIKVYSMEILYRLTLIYPELANELSALIRILMEEGSGAIVARGSMILKKIVEMPLKPGSSHL